jgi:hypothetical protein
VNGGIDDRPEETDEEKTGKVREMFDSFISKPFRNKI